MNEPTLEQLEKLLEAFRINGGSDAEVSEIAQELIREFVPHKAKETEEIFPQKAHPEIEKIKEFKRVDKKPVKMAFKDLWSKKLVKYPVLFTLSFVIIFSVINWPLVVAKFTPTKESVKYETIREVVRPETERSAPLEAGEVIPNIDEVVLPKINVKAPINFINSNAEADIKESLRTGVVHYYGTAVPGQVGNTFVTGHSSNYWWEKGSYNYVFANLDKLVVGDQAKIYYKGNKYVYQLKSIKVVDPTDVSVLQPTTTPTLTLMTCTPPGTNWKRLILQFDQIAPQAKAPQIIEKTQPITQPQNLPKENSTFMDWVAKIFGL
jgi:sortase A